MKDLRLDLTWCSHSPLEGIKTASDWVWHDLCLISLPLVYRITEVQDPRLPQGAQFNTPESKLRLWSSRLIYSKTRPIQISLIWLGSLPKNIRFCCTLSYPKSSHCHKCCTGSVKIPKRENSIILSNRRNSSWFFPEIHIGMYVNRWILNHHTRRKLQL